MKQKKTSLFNFSTLLLGLGVYLFLYLPILVLIVYSFNDSRLNAVWSGFTLKWYKTLLENQSVLDAALNSVVVALASTAAATVLGTLTAIGMYRYTFRGKTVLDGMLYVPVIIPEIVMGVAMLSFFSMLQISLGLVTIILAHITFCVPFVILVVRARLNGFDVSLEEAALDLGATPWQTFRQVTLPIIMPGIVAGALMAATLSLDDVIISFFVTGPGSTTLPIKVYSMVRFGVSPEINALSTLMLLASLSIAVLAERLRSKQTAGAEE